MIVYLTRDIPAFVMYCVYGASHSSLLIESTNSMNILGIFNDKFQVVLQSMYTFSTPIKFPNLIM